jgi:hypothetical protein
MNGGTFPKIGVKGLNCGNSTLALFQLFWLIIVGFLRFFALFCCFLRFFAVVCGFLRLFAVVCGFLRRQIPE